MKDAFTIGLCAVFACLAASARSAEPAAAEPPPALPAIPAGATNETATVDLGPNASTQDDYLKLLERFVSEKESPPVIFSVRCKNVSAETLRRLVENFLTPAGTVACSDEDDVLVISDTPERIAHIKEIIRAADQPVPQVLVEARIVEFEINDSLAKEIKAGFAHQGDSDTLRDVFSSMILPTSTAKYASSVEKMDAVGGGSSGRLWTFAGSDSYKVWGVVNYLETKNRARLLSSPNLVIRRGADGNINTGEKVPIETETTTGSSISKSTRFENVGVKLIVRPIMVSGDRIRLRINPEFSNISRTDPASKAPYIALRSATTELEAKSGDMIVLGGLLRKEERVTDTSVPFLGSLPLLGWLFRGTSTQYVTSQLVIFMTPYLVTAENAAFRADLQGGRMPPADRARIRALEQRFEEGHTNLWSEQTLRTR